MIQSYKSPEVSTLRFYSFFFLLIYISLIMVLYQFAVNCGNSHKQRWPRFIASQKIPHLKKITNDIDDKKKPGQSTYCVNAKIGFTIVPQATHIDPEHICYRQPTSYQILTPQAPHQNSRVLVFYWADPAIFDVQCLNGNFYLILKKPKYNSSALDNIGLFVSLYSFLVLIHLTI